jgi:hypothetical protein
MATARPTDPRPDPGPAAPALLEPRADPRRRLRLSGLVFLLVPLLFIAAVALRSWMSRRQEFPLIAERGRTEGIPALKEGHFDQAYQLLSAAKTAVDALGGAVEGAEQIREAANEAALYVDLASSSMEEMLQEAGRTEPDAWAARFETLYKGRSILIDSRIQAVPASGGPAGYLLDYRVFPPGEATHFLAVGAPPERYAELDLAGFELLELGPPRSVGDRVIFGARLDSMRYDSESKRWVVRLEPKSGVIIVHPEALQAIGWPVPKEIDEPMEGRPQP